MSTVRYKEKVIGDTIYVVENVIGEHARETAYDKIKRMILTDAEHMPEMIAPAVSARAVRKADNRIAS